MFARADVIKVKPGCDFPRALDRHALDRVFIVKVRQPTLVVLALLSVREDL
jgi:hypothetical protein